MKISVVGLGKLGAPMAALFAAKGHTVWAHDRNDRVLAAIEAGRAPYSEPKLQETMDLGRANLRATADPDELVASTDITFIVVPTPSDETGAFSNRFVLSAVERLGEALRSKESYHVVVVTSTVMPGAMDGVIKQALERSSNRSVPGDLGLCYNPEFIALGSVIDNMLEPDFLLIGESDARAGEMTAAVYEPICARRPVVRRMNFVNAELAKIAVNTFVTTKISYANMLADMCDHLPGADVDAVAEAVGSDSRIGRKYLRGAIGYGGPCFPRDNIAFAALAARVGARADLATATDAINRYQVERLATAVRKHADPGARVAVLGLSYKPDTAVIEESQGVMLAARLVDDGYSVIIHDPVATAAAARAIGAPIEQATTLDEALARADIAIITTPWPEYATIGTHPRARSLPVIDCWRMLPTEGARVIRLGAGDPLEAAPALALGYTADA